jgi:hypothetical protein
LKENAESAVFEKNFLFVYNKKDPFPSVSRSWNKLSFLFLNPLGLKKAESAVLKKYNKAYSAYNKGMTTERTPGITERFQLAIYIIIIIIINKNPICSYKAELLGLH